ncbi:hypothetical protein CMI37_16630, partial [Candidatus Pacearchaeota archaeon]|nr:hypothetical protein [Candidatus Pacearchaeota archaeon]
MSCSFEECSRERKGRGYCAGHLRQLRAGEELRALRPRRLKHETPVVCTFEGCDRDSYAHGLCSGHYQQKKRKKTLTPLGQTGGSCSVKGCERKHYSKTYCRVHYKRLRRTGSLHSGWNPSQVLEAETYLLVEIRGPKRGGAWFKLDKSDRPYVEGKSFSLDSGGYARRWGGGRIVYLARELTDCPEDLEVDHVNGDRLDNRRANLRIVTRAQQMQNKKPWGKSGHRNVYETKHGTWQVVCKKDGKSYSGGRHKDLASAIEAAKALREKLFTHANEDRVALQEEAASGELQAGRV